MAGDEITLATMKSKKKSDMVAIIAK